MRKAFLNKQQKSLLEIRGQVLADISDDAKQGMGAEKDDGRDTYDLASDERDRDIGMILSNRDRDKLAQIDGALTRINKGSYGICEECELDIAEDRLKALPFSRLCVICQADKEKEARQTRRPDEERSYRRMGGGEGDEAGE
ncbi:MAG TPA: molecular chaperone DnaK [Deltaproteobacteria bacterium]|nr:molecular chaperone DnaK [Deltaproteobacteria bacterium]